jgi:hypothetical protein
VALNNITSSTAQLETRDVDGKFYYANYAPYNPHRSQKLGSISEEIPNKFKFTYGGVMVSFKLMFLYRREIRVVTKEADSVSRLCFYLCCYENIFIIP